MYILTHCGLQALTTPRKIRLPIGQAAGGGGGGGGINISDKGILSTEEGAFNTNV